MANGNDKAFDTVPNRRLVQKLECYDQRLSSAMDWAFLAGRSQLVKVNGEKSNHCQVQSGTPQRIVLGTLHFVLYINDLSLPN